jgi:hypothetical protein
MTGKNGQNIQQVHVWMVPQDIKSVAFSGLDEALWVPHRMIQSRPSKGDIVSQFGVQSAYSCCWWS